MVRIPKTDDCIEPLSVLEKNLNTDRRLSVEHVKALKDIRIWLEPEVPDPIVHNFET